MAEILDWLKLADKFAEDGDAESMIGAANEILEIDKNCAEGYAVKAESALYLGDLKRAENFLAKTFALDENNLRGRLVQGGIFAEKFQLLDEFKILDAVISDAKKIGDKKILFKALCWSVNGLYLAGNAQKAAENLREIQRLRETGGLDAGNFFNVAGELPMPKLTVPTSEGGTTNSTSNTSNNSSVNMNFGDVNINNGADFEEFMHRLKTLFTQSAVNYAGA